MSTLLCRPQYIYLNLSKDFCSSLMVRSWIFGCLNPSWICFEPGSTSLCRPQPLCRRFESQQIYIPDIFTLSKNFTQTIVSFEKKYVWMHSLCRRFESQEGFLINKYTYLIFLHCQKKLYSIVWFEKRPLKMYGWTHA